MKYLHKFTVGLFAFTLSFNCLSAQFNKNHLKTIDSALTVLHQKAMFNGVVLLAEKGEIVYQKQLGVESTDSNKPLTLQSSFNLASVSKQFMAMMIMQLKEKNKLQYDDKVQQYLKKFPYPNITIRHLLTHTSGLEEYETLTLQYNNTLDTLDNQKMLDLLAAYQPALHFVPGEKWEYSNTGYVLLGSIIAQVAEMPVEVFFKQSIAQPLQLNNTYIHYLNMRVTDSASNKRVLGFNRVNGKNQPDDLIRLDGVIGDGNIYSSAADLLKWDQALYTEKLVAANTLKEAFTPVKLNNGTTFNYGFGWGISNDGKTLSHTGSWVGFRNAIERNLATKQTIIILTSGHNAIARTVINEIFANQTPSIPNTQLINNVQIIDGTGLPAKKGAVRLSNDKILEIGNLSPFKNEQVINGNGLTLAPGFIDTHSHHLGSLKNKPEAIPMASQGITTITIGQDGESYAMDTLVEFFKRRPVAVNVASYTGQSTLREETMGEDHLLRIATEAEIKEMKLKLANEMKKGSLGLSTGLEYESAFYSNRYEVIELAKVAKEYNGRYISHIRSEDINLEEALDEIIDIGRIAKIPVQISHIKIARKDLWGTAPQVIEKLQTARSTGVNITADIYPYNFWNSTLKILFPNRDYTNPASAAFAVNQLFDADQSVLIRFAAEPSYEGKTVSAIAKMMKADNASTLMKLIAMAEDFRKKNPDYKGYIETIMGKSMDDQDVADFMSWPMTNICSDGSGSGHPRGHGAFTRVLAKYVREQKTLSLENAIYKMTGLSAEHLGIKDRGTIVAGNYADLVLFNPATVKDNADVKNGTAISTGIEMVWLNGQLIYKNQKATGKYPGKLIKRDF
ncbi:MAG: serine hydrolase [Sphingobacteriia bacterium]